MAALPFSSLLYMWHFSTASSGIRRARSTKTTRIGDQSKLTARPFCRVLLLSAAQQPGAARVGSAALDYRDYGGLGPDFLLNGAGRAPREFVLRFLLGVAEAGFFLA